MSRDETESFHKFRVATEFVSRTGHPVSVIFNGVNANSWLSPIGISSNPVEEPKSDQIVIPSRPKSTGSITLVRHHPRPSGLKRDEIVIGHHLKSRNEDELTDYQQNGNEECRRPLPFEECQGHVGSFLFNQRVTHKGFKGGGFCDGPSKRPRPYTSCMHRGETSTRALTPSLELTVKSFDLCGKLVSQKEEKAKLHAGQKQNLNANVYEELSKTCVKRVKSAPPRPVSCRSTKTPSLYWRAKSAYHRKTAAPNPETDWDAGENNQILRGSMLRPLLYSSVQDIQHSAGCPYKCKGCFRACLVSEDYLEKSRTARQPTRNIRDLRYRSFVKKDPRYILHRALARNQPIYKLVHGYCDEKTVKEAWDDGGTIRGQAEGSINLDQVSVLGSRGISTADAKEDIDSVCDVSSQDGVFVKTRDVVESVQSSTLSRLSRTDSCVHLQPSRFWSSPTRRVRSAELEKRGHKGIVPSRSKSCSEPGKAMYDYTISTGDWKTGTREKQVDEPNSHSGTPQTTDSNDSTNKEASDNLKVMPDSPYDLQDGQDLDLKSEDDRGVSEISSISGEERKGSVDGRSVLSDDSFLSETLSITRDTTSHASLSDDEITISEHNVSETYNSVSGHSSKTPSSESASSERSVNSTIRNNLNDSRVEKERDQHKSKDSVSGSDSRDSSVTDNTETGDQSESPHSENVSSTQSDIHSKRNSRSARLYKRKRNPEVKYKDESDQQSQGTMSSENSIGFQNSSISVSSQSDTERESGSDSDSSDCTSSSDEDNEEVKSIRKKRDVKDKTNNKIKQEKGKLKDKAIKAKLVRQERKDEGDSVDTDDAQEEERKDGAGSDSEGKMSINLSIENSDTPEKCDNIIKTKCSKANLLKNPTTLGKTPKRLFSKVDARTNRRNEITHRKMKRTSISRETKPSPVTVDNTGQSDRRVIKKKNVTLQHKEGLDDEHYNADYKEEISNTSQLKTKSTFSHRKQPILKDTSSEVQLNSTKRDKSRTSITHLRDRVPVGRQSRDRGRSSSLSTNDDGSVRSNGTEDSSDTEVAESRDGDSGTSESVGDQSDSDTKRSDTDDSDTMVEENSDHGSNSD